MTTKLQELRAQFDQISNKLAQEVSASDYKIEDADTAVRVESMTQDTIALREKINAQIKTDAQSALDAPALNLTEARTHVGGIETAEVDDGGRKWLREFAQGRTEDRGTVTSTTYAGAIPENLYARFIEIMGRLSAVRAAATVDRFSSADIKYSKQASQVTISSATAEGAAMEAFDTTAGTVVPTIIKFTAHSDITTEALNDSLFSLEDAIMRQQAEGIAAAFETAMVQGTNSQDGVFVAHTGSTTHTTATASTITIADLVAGLASLASTGYFSRPGKFIVSGGAIDSIITGEDTTGRLLLQTQQNASAAQGVPFSVFGHDVLVSNGAVAFADSTHQACFLAEDSYHCSDVGTMSMIRDPFTKANEGEVRLLSSMRSSGNMVQALGHVTFNIKPA